VFFFSNKGRQYRFFSEWYSSRKILKEKILIAINADPAMGIA
jgi:hypothetical protein